MKYKIVNINLVPDTVNPTPDYYCTWQTQLYTTSDGKPEEQRKAINEKSLFDKNYPYGWAYFYREARKDLFLVMDDSWDVPLDNNTAYYGSLRLNEDKFPTFTKDTDNGLKPLSEKIKSLGWKGLGGWVCAQESPVFKDDKSEEEYWKDLLIKMNEAGFSYWKVDWGKKARSFEFRKMLTLLARKYAPNLIIEHAMIKEIIPHADVFRTYDVPAIMSIPMTMEKLKDFCCDKSPAGDNKGLINCEDEAYIAAAGGFAMGIMRHPFSDNFPNGKADMSFPDVHRNLKTKMFEIIRASRWHRIAPAFSGGEVKISKEILSDCWEFINKNEEIEEWWFENPLVRDFVKDDVLKKSAPAIVARNTELPLVKKDQKGLVPFVVSSINPNGAFSVATLGRTLGREYFIPKCDITVKTKKADTIGVFGEYKNLIIETELEKIYNVFIQDLASDTAFDITDLLHIENGKITVPGSIISEIGTSVQPNGDTSEPGVIIKIQQ